jgi:RNA polymerase sigma-70 factor (ECF subfamily)
MTPSAGSDLLDRLGRGDPTVTRDLYLAYNSYLRVVVRKLLSPRLRAASDSSDVIQSVWVQVARALEADGWKVESELQLRALLVVIARRGVSKRYRSTERAVADPDAGARLDELPLGNQSRPSETAVGNELWQRLLEKCPPEHRPLLELRREGVTLAEVAARTGLHEGSVRRIIRQLARELAIRPTRAGG